MNRSRIQVSVLADYLSVIQHVSLKEGDEGAMFIGKSNFSRPIRTRSTPLQHGLSITTSAMDQATPSSQAMNFSVLASTAPTLAPRVGKLAIPGRKTIATPHHVPLTSRGTVPHVAHDVMREQTAINNVYAGLEDCKWNITIMKTINLSVLDETDSECPTGHRISRRKKATACI